MAARCSILTLSNLLVPWTPAIRPSFSPCENNNPSHTERFIWQVTLACGCLCVCLVWLSYYKKRVIECCVNLLRAVIFEVKVGCMQNIPMNKTVWLGFCQFHPVRHFCTYIYIYEHLRLCNSLGGCAAKVLCCCARGRRFDSSRKGCVTRKQDTQAWDFGEPQVV